MNSKVIKYGDNVDTDVIIPARYLNASSEEHLAQHCMEDLDSEFNNKAKTRKIIVGGKNFGCGSSREHAPIAIKAAGIQCVIAESFARIFYRNSINIGLPIIECEEAAKNIEDNDEIIVNLEEGTIENVTKGKSYKAEPFPEFIREIIDTNGLVNMIRGKVEQ
ncbi:3-isopropylmalate dehydratase small subunit [Clostridium sediminicola]|uniref:3-isopropylmalate dehydratase small subunit n=1 Tax=Clostridium sediminicola TaxID=3114879 RepID=UPI0031F23349